MLSQSLLTLHAWLFAHFLQFPPQSVPLSSWFLILSSHFGAAHVPLWQKLVLQSMFTLHFLFKSHKSHPLPQSTSLSFSSLMPLVQFNGFRLVSIVMPSLSVILLDNPTIFCDLTLKKYLLLFVNPNELSFGFFFIRHSFFLKHSFPFIFVLGATG